MSFRGEKYDGDFPGGSSNTSERRDPFDNEGKIDRNASAKRTNKQVKLVESEEDPFQESGDRDRYLITYADLITLLLGLFIILYTTSNVDSVKYRSVISAAGTYFGNRSVVPATQESKIVPHPKEKLADELSKLIVENNYNDSIQLEENDRGITIHILENILFPPGKAELNEASKLVLKRIATVIKKLPNDIRIEGHTDNTPINTTTYPSNWHLSANRALNTGFYLIKTEGISPDKVTIVGNGEYKPITSNDSPETRSKNRRVDLVILK